MTEREKELIDAYIPSPRDNDLGRFEYYVEDSGGKIQRVEITDICLTDDETIYLVVQHKTYKRIKGWQKYDGFTMSEMYDNKKDCKDSTHSGYSNWEHLRKIQKQDLSP